MTPSERSAIHEALEEIRDQTYRIGQDRGPEDTFFDDDTEIRLKRLNCQVNRISEILLTLLPNATEEETYWLSRPTS